MVTRARTMIIVYLIAITIGGISATKFYQLSLNYNEETPWYDKALEINPNDTTALKAKGTALYEQGDYKNALKYYNKVLEISTNDTQAMMGKSLVESKIGPIR